MTHSSTRPPVRLVVLVAVACVLGVCALLVGKRTRPGGQSSGDTNAAMQRLISQVLRLEAQEDEVSNTSWAKELLAERCGVVFEGLWDAINAATNKWIALAAFPVEELIAARYGSARSLGHGLDSREAGPPLPAWSPEAWRRLLAATEAAGWQIANVEFRHDRFDLDAAGKPARSQFLFRAHLTNPGRSERALFEGDLIVHWAADHVDGAAPGIRRVDASRLALRTGQGPAAFVPVFNQEFAPVPGSHFIDPLLLFDLDGDGRSEIILAARNVVLKRLADGRFESKPLCREPPGLIFTGVLADFDGDGFADFLCAKFEGLVLLKGSPEGRFDAPGRQVWAANPHLKYAQALTCGDVDGDGDLDVWLGQYKGPYDRGQMPTPFYDANDGNPSFLLLNDGHGGFTEATQAAGLAPKRLRRSYSASLVDLDNDGDLDLLVVSDFAGVDLYANDGHGRFTDMTAKWLPTARAFGMAHAFADFDRDGRLDFFVTGMACPTAQRLDHLGLSRSERPDYDTMRTRMTAGNLLGLASPSGGFRRGPLNDSVARSGWSWGCSAADFDNDGFPDLYVANGHESRQSVRDYETEFWLHDIYVGRSQDDLTVGAYFGVKFGRTRGQGWSYGGYEKNRLYLNEGGARFVEVGHLLGVALEEDSRNVVTDDLDGDGRPDLLVTTFEAWPKVRQTLRIFQNQLEPKGNWIGFRLREQPGCASPIGAALTLRAAGERFVRQLVTGDSHRAQHANTVLFGLGAISHVDEVEVRWPNGRVFRLREPAVGQYHLIALPPKSEARSDQR
jgi:hypothetical protein